MIKLCIDCKHCSKGAENNHPNSYRCETGGGNINPVNGERNSKDGWSCIYQRSSDRADFCGISAKYFEPKDARVATLCKDDIEGFVDLHVMGYAGGGNPHGLYAHLCLEKHVYTGETEDSELIGQDYHYFIRRDLFNENLDSLKYLKSLIASVDNLTELREYADTLQPVCMEYGDDYEYVERN